MATDFDLLIKGKKKVPADVLHKETYPPFCQFEKPGDWIEGTLSEPREIEQADGRKSKVMTITTAQGTAYSIGLSSRLNGLWDMSGKRVIIRFMGFEKSGSFYTKEFDVFED